MGTLWQDLRYAMRMLAKSPGFAAVAVLTLALGIGPNAAIFSVVNALLLRPLPYVHPEQIVVMRESTKRLADVSVSYLNFLDWRQQSHSFAQMAAAHNRGFNFAGAGEPENINGYAVSPEFLRLLDVRPLLGRDFLPQEEKPGTTPVAILGYNLWQSHFGGDPLAIGKSITLDGRSFTIVGVLPPAFRFLDTADLLAPMGVWAGEMTERGDRGDMDVIGRLAPGVTLAQAQAEMDAIAARLASEYPKENTGFGVNMTTIREELVSDSRTEVLVVFGAVLFVLLIACVNVANLFLARSAARAKEIAVRQTFGASRGRIIRQLLTESVLLAAFGGGLGLVLGIWGITGLGHLMPADSFQMMDVRLDRMVMLFIAVTVVLVALAFGLFPSLQASRSDIQETLKEGERGATAGARQHRLRGALAIAETALALVLLAGAGLMLKSMYRILRVNPGFQPQHVLQMEMNLRSVPHTDKAALLSFWQQVLSRVSQVPGVESAALGTVIPLTGNHDRTDITIEGQPLPAAGEFPHPDYHIISAGYIHAMGIALLRGRAFTDADNETAPQVVLINATLANRYWPNEDPTGRRILFGQPGSNKPWATIVGVVGDTKLYGLANPARFEVYIPYRQSPTNDMNLVVRSSLDPAGLTPEIRSAVASVDKSQPIFGIETMNQVVDDSVASRRVTLILLGLFSALAMILASVGIYGVMAYNAALRTHEIGVRMALGAQRRDVFRLVLGQGTRMALWGVGLGTVGALGLTRLLSSLLFEVNANDPTTFLAVAAALVLVSLTACYLPVRRAVRVDPMVALRYE